MLLSLMYIIEENRNKLVYGKPNKIVLEAVYKAFQNVHEIIKK